MSANTIIRTAADVFGIDSSLWIKEEKVRIYAKTPNKNMVVFLDLENTDLSPSAMLKIYCNIQQHPNWIRNQVDSYRKKYIGLVWSYIIDTYGETGDVSHLDPMLAGMIQDARVFYREAKLARNQI